MFHLKTLLIIIIIIIIIIMIIIIIIIMIIFSYIMRITCIFNITVFLTISPPMTTDGGYYRTIFSDVIASHKMYRRREASACPIPLSTKQDSRRYHCMWYDAAGYPIRDLSILMRMLYHLSYRGWTNVALCEIYSSPKV